MSLRTRLWRMIRYDIGRKLTALALALGVWFLLEDLVLGEQRPLVEVKTFTSLEAADRDRLTASRSTLYLVVPETLQMKKFLPGTLRLHLQGLKEDVRNLAVFATLEFFDKDLGAEDEAVVTRTLGRESFKGRDRSPELTYFRINGEASGTVSITLARRTSVTLTLGPANVTTSGTPARGYRVDMGRIQVKQYQVDLIGPRALVEKYRTEPGALKLSPVAVEGAQRTVTQVVGLPAADLAAQLRLSQPSIEVTVPIVEEDVEVTLVSLPINYRNEQALAKKGFRLAATPPPPETRDVRVRGPAPELRGLQLDELARRIDLVFDFETAVLSEGPNRHPLSVFKLELSDGVRVYGMDGRDEEPRVEFKLEESSGGP
jgi:hypothetical protein